jgi:hypothetical protein
VSKQQLSWFPHTTRSGGPVNTYSMTSNNLKFKYSLKQWIAWYMDIRNTEQYFFRWLQKRIQKKFIIIDSVTYDVQIWE